MTVRLRLTIATAENWSTTHTWGHQGIPSEQYHRPLVLQQTTMNGINHILLTTPVRRYRGNGEYWQRIKSIRITDENSRFYFYTRRSINGQLTFFWEESIRGKICRKKRLIHVHFKCISDVLQGLCHLEMKVKQNFQGTVRNNPHFAALHDPTSWHKSQRGTKRLPRTQENVIGGCRELKVKTNNGNYCNGPTSTQSVKQETG